MRTLIILAVLIMQAAGCKAIRPDRDDGPIIDASRNIRTVQYHPVARPDNPFPVQSNVFIRHFLYVHRSAPWTIVSSGDSSPGTQFEETGVYLLRRRPAENPVRLLRVPGLRTDGVSAPSVRLAIAAPSVVLFDGPDGPVGQIRNTSGQALVHIEDGPLYGGFTVDIPDTVEVADQIPRLLVDGRVRAAALAFNGVTAAFLDDVGRLFTLDITAGGPPQLVVDLRSFMGPVEISEIQWPIGTDANILLKIDRGDGPESWSVRLLDRMISPSTVVPGSIQEPGTNQLSMVNQLTQAISAGVWRVPAPSRFE